MCDRLEYNGFTVNVGAIHKKVQVLEEENLQLKVEVSQSAKLLLLLFGNTYKAPCIGVKNMLKGADNIK